MPVTRPWALGPVMPVPANLCATIVSSTMFITAVVVIVTVITVLKREMVAATTSAPSLVKKNRKVIYCRGQAGNGIRVLSIML